MQINLILSVILTIAVFGIQISSHPVLMHNILVHFLKPVSRCQQEMGLPDTIYNDFYNFWSEDYVITNNATGCAFICIAARLNLIVNGPNSHINLNTFFQYSRKRGADDQTAKRLLQLLRYCEGQSRDETDTCMRVVHCANCFRREIHALNWAPKVEEIP
ncbi:PREDICTED: pheromone-binding protein-like [Papilio xuthus]|uniref:Pheromone-binding protein-like n=2 Tax=Papilio xuthus TaxID=66420 RepID=A0AAJ7E4N2_PAPXU|nr:PREDICTED: pheromone-binding protein-like [Papilio xuthus]